MVKRIEGLHGLLCLILLAEGVLIVGERLNSGGPQLLQLVQPERNFQPPELIPEQ